MRVIIENMEMPKNCYDCGFVCDSFGSCDLTDEKIPDYKFFPIDDELERPKWCPLKKEIPDNATNGDIFKTLFDVKEVRKYTRVTAWASLDGCYIVPIDFQLKWWNAPYKKGENNE